jgi:hypothetical protein
MSIFTCSRKPRANPSNSPNLSDYNDAVALDNASTQSSSLEGVLSTNELQIETIGYDANQALRGSKIMETISVYGVECGMLRQEKYTSVRPKKNSNSCGLVRSSDPHRNALISTVYRWGPGRPPRLHILPIDANMSVEQAINDDDLHGELIKVKSRSIMSRAQIFDTSFGKFEWRYGSRKEREDCDADSLLILEHMDHGITVAQLIRNDRLRTSGSVRDSRGNGGRLVMDMSAWKDEKSAGADGMEAFFVASCILMLKKEADRFIDNNIAAVV